MLYLVVIKLTKVLHIHFALINVCNGSKAIKCCTVLLCSFCSTDNIRKLTNTRGLDNYSIRCVLLKHLNKSLGKITNERAANTTGVHLCDLDTRIGKEASVNTNLTKLVFDKHNLFTGICLGKKLLYQGCFTGTEESGKYIYLCHYHSPLNNTFTINIVLQIYKKVKKKKRRAEALRLNKLH